MRAKSLMCRVGASGFRPVYLPEALASYTSDCATKSYIRHFLRRPVNDRSS
jgi:hypothetical protein